MRNSVCKTLPLAIAFLLVVVGTAFAGQNAGVTFALDSPAEFTGIGPGNNTVTFTLSAAAVVGVKQYDVTVKVTPADAFDLNATAFAPGNTAFLVPGKEVNVTAGTVKIGAANLLASVDGALVLGTFTFTTAAGFTTSTEATISASLISLGPSSSNRDIFNEAALGLSATVNPPAPAPTVASITPNSALVTGGVAVTIAGANFQDGATVTIGANAATNVKFVSATSLTATAPAGAVGAVDVVVANPDGQSATLAGGFTYLAIPPPTVTSITPNSASMTGGVAVTIAGANFQSGATVTIGGTAATNVKFVSATSLTATAPAGAAGAADVVVANPDGQSATLAGGFTYLSVIEPTLSRVGAADVSLDYSAIGEGEVQDGSAGEATFKVRFTGNKGAAVAGQAVSWAITNNGSETVYVVGGGSAEILSGDAQTIQVATDAEGGSVIVLDAQGGKQAGTTSVSIVASTTAPNSEGVSRSLSRTFTATWDVPVVAELASFTGTVTPGNEVLLQWSVASQSNNLGWEVFRSTDNLIFERVGDLVLGDGTSDAFKSYSFTDSDLPRVGVLYYYLGQVDLDGTTTRSQVIEVALATAVTQQALPVANALWQNYPNPFNPETTISFELSEEAVVTLTVYDLTGQVVRTLVSGQAMAAGSYQAAWDGRSESGIRVSSGVYLYRLNAGAYTATKKMTLLQ